MTTCSACGASIPAASIDPELSLAHCGACGHVQEVTASAHTAQRALPPPVPAEPALPVAEPVRRRMTHPVLPRSMELVGDPPYALRRAWSSGPHLVLAGIGAVFALFALGPLGVPLLGYIVAAVMMNRTTVGIEHDTVYTDVGPVPWPNGQVRLLRSSVLSIQARKSTMKVNNQPMYEVVAALQGGRTKQLLSALPQHDAEAAALALDDLLR